MASPFSQRRLEVLAGEELLHGEIGGQLDQVGKSQLREPLGVVADDGLLAVEDFESLLGVGAGVGFHLLGGELRAQLILIGRVADQRGVVADQEGDLVAQLLELAQLAHGDGVTQVQVGGARVVAAVDAQRAPLLLGFDQPLAQLLLHGLFQLIVAVLGALHQVLHLFINAQLCHHLLQIYLHPDGMRWRIARSHIKKRPL